MKPSLDATYWEHRYKEGSDGWDTGAVTTPLKTYFDQLTNKDLRILIPGAGRGYEAEYLHRAGFTNVFVIDLTDAPFKDLLERCPDFHISRPLLDRQRTLILAPGGLGGTRQGAARR